MTNALEKITEIENQLSELKKQVELENTPAKQQRGLTNSRGQFLTEPVIGTKYWCANSYGDVVSLSWDGESLDKCKLAKGDCYNTEENCKRGTKHDLIEAHIEHLCNFDDNGELWEAKFTNYGTHVTRDRATVSIERFVSGKTEVHFVDNPSEVKTLGEFEVSSEERWQQIQQKIDAVYGEGTFEAFAKEYRK